ncbi:hypothetical protein [Sphingomonas sp.]|jgi:hypothetical protein|uniref:hypothetical protein n=1 Tax=Sphingomonas sp. TaxID=28214 RepID=UPI002ED9CCE7
MIGAHQRAAIRNETMVSVAINAIVPTAIIWAAGVTPPAMLAGAQGLLAGMAKGSGIATLLMTAIVTLLIRKRVRAKPALALAPSELPPLVRSLPGNVVARAIIMSLVAMILLVPAGAAVATVLGILPLDTAGFVIFNVLFGTIVGLTMTPMVVMRALADERA